MRCELVFEEESKPDSVYPSTSSGLSAIYLKYDLLTLATFDVVPSNIGTPVKRVITYRSEVAAGRIARFTPTRLCCSQVLLIQNLFLVPHVGKALRHQLLLIGAYAPSPALYLSGLSSRPQLPARKCCALCPTGGRSCWRVAELPPRASVFYPI